MTIAAIGQIAKGYVNAEAGTTLVIATTASAAAGNLVIVSVAKKNVSTGVSATNEVISVEDCGHSGWWKLAEYCNGRGAANAGVVTSLWASVLTAPIPINTSKAPVVVGTITITFSSAIAQRSANAYAFSISTPMNTVAQAVTSLFETANATDWGVLTFAAALPSAEYLTIRTAATNGSNTSQSVTATWTSLAANRGTVSPFITNWAEYKIATSTGEVSSVSSGITDDSASVAVVLKEYLVPSEQAMVLSV